ncbi:MAG: S41 family peptidase [Chloroflexota bacterium]|nr:S41 family peptidase [Chloroflexota bacterium]
MDNVERKSSPLVFIVVLVAIVAFGLGAGTMFLAGQAATVAGVAGNLGAQPTPVVVTEGGTGAVPTELANDPAWQSFVATYNAINHEFYYRPVDRDELVYGAAKGMIEALGDDYSSFQTPVEAEREASNMQGNFEGVGITIGTRNDLPTVIAPIPNTPAEKAGVRAGDVIAGVDGRDVTTFTPSEIANLVRGPAGTKVRLTLIRGDKPYDVELTRARIEVPAVTLTMVDGYAHIEMSIFNEKTTPELDEALASALSQNAKGVILDLRNNGGGLVVQALQVLGRFLPEGSVGFYESRKSDGSEDEPHEVIANAPESLDLNKTRNIPMVVLTNGGSASASEIVAGALQDYGRATLVGEQTFGKGSEQHVYQWQDGTSAHITFAHWLTPKKRDINPRPEPTVGPGTPEVLPTFTPTPQSSLPPAQATATAQSRPLYPAQTDRGLTPDVPVVRTEKDYLEDKDPQLERAVEFLKTGK